MSGTGKLRLEVVLAAIDKATRPIRSVMGSSKGLSKQLRDTCDQLKAVNQAQAQIQQFRDVSKGAAVTANQMRAAQERVKALKVAMGETLTPSKALTREFEKAKQVASDLKVRHGQLIEKQQRLRDSLKAAGTDTRKLADAQRTLKGQADSLNQSLQQQQKRLEAVSQKQKRMSASRASYDQGREMRDRVAGAGAATIGAGTVVGLPIVKMVRDYSSYEDAMLGVARQVEGARDANGRLTATYYEMGDAIKAMSETIPMATTEIAALVEGGARMGVQGKENLLAFARTAALASTAFDLPADQISEDLGKIANVFKVPIKNISQLGDVINYLDDNAQSKGADIIDVMQRVAGSVGSMDYKEAAALGSTFLSLGASSEVAASATKAMVRELAIAEKQPARFRKGLKELGMDAKKVQADMAKDSTGTLLRVMDAVRKLPKAKQMGVLTDLFGKEFGDDAAKLAENLDEYRKQLALVKDQKASGSMQREGDAKKDTLSAQWQITQNKLFIQSSELGNALRQPLLEVMYGVSGVLKSIGAWTKANPELTATLVKIAAAITVAMVAMGGLLVAVAGMLGPFLLSRFVMARFFIQLTSGLKLLGHFSSVFGIVGRVLMFVGRVAIFSTIGLLGKLGTALGLVGKMVLFIGRAFLFTPLGMMITVLAGGAYLIWRNWSTLGPMWSKFWSDVGRGANIMWDGIKNAASSALNAVSSAASTVWGSIRQAFSGGIMGVSMLILNWSPLGLFYQAMAAVLSWFGISLPAKFTDFGRNMLQGLVNGITSALGAVKAAITGAGESAVGWFKEKLGIHSPSRVFASLGGFTMAGLAQGIEGGQGGALGAVMSVAKKLTAAGAGIAFGATSAVAGAASVAIDHRPPIAAAAPAPTGAGQIIAPTINVYPSPGMNEQKLAELVAREVEKLQRQAAARGRSRLTDKD